MSIKDFITEFDTKIANTTTQLELNECVMFADDYLLRSEKMINDLILETIKIYIKQKTNDTRNRLSKSSIH
jgi:hypothetical protein